MVRVWVWSTPHPTPPDTYTPTYPQYLRSMAAVRFLRPRWRLPKGWVGLGWDSELGDDSGDLVPCKKPYPVVTYLS